MRTAFPEPARPVKGGIYSSKLPLSPHYDWVIEPKYNGWRVVLDTESGHMYNRHGNRLTKEDTFKRAASLLSECFDGLIDCEGLGFRNDMGKGSLVALDLMDFNDLPLLDRVNQLGLMFEPLTIGTVPAMHQVYASFQYQKEEAGELRKQMELFNKEHGITFYEGVVAKRTDSSYFYGEGDKWRKFRFTYEP